MGVGNDGPGRRRIEFDSVDVATDGTVYTTEIGGLVRSYNVLDEKQIDQEREELRRKLNISVNEIELSVRAANCLNNANITTVGELCQKTEAEMLKYRNFGKKSLNEIKQKLIEMNLSLGMTIDPDLLNQVSIVNKDI